MTGEARNFPPASSTCGGKAEGCTARCPEGPAERPELRWLPLCCPLAVAPSEVRLALELSPQLPEALSELSIPAAISFDESLLEGLPQGSLRSSITLILLKEPRFHTLPIILGSSVAGLLLLLGIIAILWKCGFFKRKYQAMTSQTSQTSESMLQKEN